ncbi:MAG: CPBP family intramembrane glutamic endopeptidase [Parvibaculaceae bacterium]
MPLKPVWGIPPEEQARGGDDTPVFASDVAPAPLATPALRIRDGVFAVGLYIGGQIVAALVIIGAVSLYWGLLHGKAAGLAKVATVATDTYVLLATIIVSVIFVLLFARHLARRSVAGWGVLGFVRPRAIWFVAAGAAFLVCNALAFVFSLVAGPDVARRAAETMAFVSQIDRSALWLMALLVGVIVPLIEEIVFRATLFRSLSYRMPPLGAGVLSVGVFSIVHVQYLTSGYAVAALMMSQVLLLGSVLTWLYHKSGSIWPSVALHVFNNSWVMLVMLLWPDSGL